MLRRTVVRIFILAAAALVSFFVTLAVCEGKAHADVDLNDIAPRLTKCWGTTCLQPAASVNAGLFDLKSRTWQAGTTSLGAGLEILFAADQAYSSGVSAHLTGTISQQNASLIMPTVGVVICRYAEIGYSYKLASGTPSASYLSIALTLPWDMLATGVALPEQAKAARELARPENR